MQNVCVFAEHDSSDLTNPPESTTDELDCMICAGPGAVADRLKIDPRASLISIKQLLILASVEEKRLIVAALEILDHAEVESVVPGRMNIYYFDCEVRERSV